MRRGACAHTDARATYPCWREDASHLRCDSALQVIAASQAVLGLLRRASHTDIAAALRAAGWEPGTALHRLGIRGP